MLIILEDEHGKRIDLIRDSRKSICGLLPDSSDPSFRCIGFIDIVGDTIFNHPQFPVLIAELERLLERADVEQRGTIGRIQEFARFCLDNPHHYIRFYGD